MINTRIKELREDRELTQRDIAAYLSVAQNSYSNYEDILKDVAKELQMSNILTFPTGLDRIDYIFVSSGIEIIDYDVLIKDMSDHYPIIAKIKI